MNKKGFTLVELLSVIAILAILVIIALPNVLSMYNNARKSSFITELKSVYTAAEEKWITDSFSGSGTKTYAHCSSGNCDNELKLSGRDDLEYYIEFNSKGKIVKYYAKDNSFQYSYEGLDLKKNDINEVQSIPEITNGKYVQIACTGAKVTSPAPASRDYYLMSGTTGGSSTVFLRTTLTKTSIEKITFTDSLGGHTANGTDCWDVSYGSNGSVLAWATDTDNNGLYELTIGANGDVYAYSGSYLFYYLNNLVSIDGMINFNTSKVTYMDSMFHYCTSLRNLNLSNFDTSSVTSMTFMFSQCKELVNLDLSSFDTSKVTSMRSMFSSANNLVSVNVSSFNTEKVNNMSNMFSSCYKLSSLDLSNFNTEKVTTMASMFEMCQELASLNMSNFNTEKVTNMSNMFRCCYKLTSLDLSSWNTSLVTNMYCMFNNCTRLEKIFVSPNFVTDNVTSSTAMFTSTNSLVGGAGTTYSTSNPSDKTYAHIDEGESNPGYFTRKN